jgi:hypothetical protein
MDLLLALTIQIIECMYRRPGTRFTTSAAPVYLCAYRVDGVSYTPSTRPQQSKDTARYCQIPQPHRQ